MRDYDQRETTSRDRDRDRDFDERDRRPRGAFFGDDDRRGGRGYDDDGDRARGGWGGLMGDREDDRQRLLDRDRDRDRSRSRERWSSDRRPRDEDESRFGSEDYSHGIPLDETRRLIASNKVEGTPVFDRNGDRLGTIHNFMVDKYKGEVVYAVLKHGGGLFGMFERYYPLDWCDLTFDRRLEGYHIPLTEEDLKNRQSFDREGRWSSGRREREPEGSNRDRDRGGW